MYILHIAHILEFRAAFDISQKEHFFMKYSPSKYSPFYSIPFISVLHQNKA